MEIFARDECIFYVKELISQDLCRKFIELYEDDSRKHPGYTAGAGGGTQLEVNVKVSTDLDVETDGIWAAAFAELHPAVATVILSIAAQFPSLQVSPLRCTGYKIQHHVLLDVLDPSALRGDSQVWGQVRYFNVYQVRDFGA